MTYHSPTPAEAATLAEVVWRQIARVELASNLPASLRLRERWHDRYVRERDLHILRAYDRGMWAGYGAMDARTIAALEQAQATVLL